MFRELALLLLVVLLGYVYQAIQPPPPNICGSPNGPKLTSPRVTLSDGRHLAYKETGTPREEANHKVVVVHAFDGGKESIIPVSSELVEELKIYLVSFDRAGYGESDPNPKRSVKSEAFDIQELADHLGLGPKFYIVGTSMGGCPVWACLKYIPHRLAGAALIVPAVNFWWPSLPANLSKAGLDKMVTQNKWLFRVAHYAPWLTYWWMTQKLYPPSVTVEGHPEILSRHDKEVIWMLSQQPNEKPDKKGPQQSAFESRHRDLMVLFGDWGFDPITDVSNPFTDSNEGSVHLWQGREDKLVPVEVQRYVVEKLPWIKYHEIPEGGHLFVFVNEWSDTIVKAMLFGEEDCSVSGN